MLSPADRRSPRLPPTATLDVRDEIVGLLGFTDARIIVAGFDPPNITMSVRPVASEFEKHHLLSRLVGNTRSLVSALISFVVLRIR